MRHQRFLGHYRGLLLRSGYRRVQAGAPLLFSHEAGDLVFQFPSAALNPDRSPDCQSVGCMSGALPELQVSAAVAADAAECVVLRGLTRENAVSQERLRAFGITSGSWAEDIRAGRLTGWVARRSGNLVGYCFGAANTGEIAVLALLAQEEGKGLGRRLLQRVIDDLRSHGHTRLFLGCAKDPDVRSHGFYRHLGWRGTGRTDHQGDEILELLPP